MIIAICSSMKFLDKMAQAEKELIKKIKESDAILVLNYDKDGHENYIGPNTLLEMGIAYFLGKKIYLINPIPRFYCWEEVKAMKPLILNGDLAKIK